MAELKPSDFTKLEMGFFYEDFKTLLIECKETLRACLILKTQIEENRIIYTTNIRDFIDLTLLTSLKGKAENVAAIYLNICEKGLREKNQYDQIVEIESFNKETKHTKTQKIKKSEVIKSDIREILSAIKEEDLGEGLIKAGDFLFVKNVLSYINSIESFIRRIYNLLILSIKETYLQFLINFTNSAENITGMIVSKENKKLSIPLSITPIESTEEKQEEKKGESSEESPPEEESEEESSEGEEEND